MLPYGVCTRHTVFYMHSFVFFFLYFLCLFLAFLSACLLLICTYCILMEIFGRAFCIAFSFDLKNADSDGNEKLPLASRAAQPTQG